MIDKGDMLEPALAGAAAVIVSVVVFVSAAKAPAEVARTAVIASAAQTL